MNFTYLYPERPKLISINQPLFEKLSDDPKWVAEPKYNGSRLVLAVNGKVELWNRHGEKFDYQPDDTLQNALNDFASHTNGMCVFDGELRHNKVAGVRHKIVLWDTLVWDGELQTSKPYLVRQTNLVNTCMCLTTGQVRRLSMCPQHMGKFKDLYRDYIQDPEIEGLVIKNLNGKLNLSRTAGQPSNWMFKVRRPSNSYRF